jgi:hypothetical protein
MSGRGSLNTTLQNENPVSGQPHNHAPSDTSINYSKNQKCHERPGNQHQRQTMVYSCLNGCGATENVPSMKMKKVWALANLSKLSGK